MFAWMNKSRRRLPKRLLRWVCPSLDSARVFLMRVVADKQMPFALTAPNAETLAAMAEADEIARRHSARFDSAD